MSEFCCLQQDEGYGACDDEAVYNCALVLRQVISAASAAHSFCRILIIAFSLF